MLWHHSGHAEETTLRPASPRPPPSGANAGQECKKEALSQRGRKTDHNSHREGNNGKQIGIGFAFARAGANKLPPKKDPVLGPITRRGGLRMTILRETAALVAAPSRGKNLDPSAPVSRAGENARAALMMTVPDRNADSSSAAADEE
jgi:hypothetical protein